MTTAVHQRGYLDGWVARGIALAIALAIGLYLVFGLGDELIASFGNNAEAEGHVVEENDAEFMTPALRSCLDERVGDVEQMRAEGVLTDAQYEDFRSRAQALCQAQNPR